MKYRSPIYHLLHQEIKACAEHLLEMSQFCAKEGAEHILCRLSELHQFALKVRPDEHYTPLCDLKKYLESTMIPYQDEQNRPLTMRLSEAVALLKIPNEMDIEFKASVVSSLRKHFIRHFEENAKPGRPLFKKLIEIRKI